VAEELVIVEVAEEEVAFNGQWAVLEENLDVRRETPK
jgi:hypothetical protein